MNNFNLTQQMAQITVIFAHPDDELIYFYQMLQQLKPVQLRLICVTGKFSVDETVRLNELAQAGAQLGGELINLGLEDRRGQGLDTQTLHDRLSSIRVDVDMPVLTHGPFGEYGHRHHVDVFRAVFRRFGEQVWCLSGPLSVDNEYCLNADEFRCKQAQVQAIYSSQKVKGFATQCECLTHVSSSMFADVLLAGCGGEKVAAQRVEAFLEWVKVAYLGPHERMPVEARAVADVKGEAMVKEHMISRIEEWRACA